MSSARGKANHKLYHARILLSAWRTDVAAQEIPARTLSGAYQQAVSRHLVEAYGWFLVEIAQPGKEPTQPPLSCEALLQTLPIAEGKAIAGEIRELQQLEQRGWLGQMLDSADTVAGDLGRVRASGNLVAAASGDASPDQLDAWAEQLLSLFDRMGDSLDEY